MLEQHQHHLSQVLKHFGIMYLFPFIIVTANTLKVMLMLSTKNILLATIAFSKELRAQGKETDATVRKNKNA